MQTGDLSIEDAAAQLGLPCRLLERAVENGLLLPKNGRPPWSFTRQEIDLVGNYDSLPTLLSRIRRDADGDCLGRYIGPDEFIQQNQYILPFGGCWLVSDGGKLRTAKGRMRSFDYYIAPCVRWAWDFGVIHSADYGKCHEGMTIAEMLRLRFRKGQVADTPDYAHSEPGDEQEFRQVLNPQALDNTLHYLYEVKLIAPAPGVIMTRQGRLHDPAFGEQVEGLRARGEDDDHEGFLIDHGKDEFSQFSHVLGRTLAVRPGQKVERGEFLCKAGGKHRFMTHLHWAIWDSSNPLLAQGVPVRISACQVYRNGQFVLENEVWLERGMLVRNIP